MFYGQQFNKDIEDSQYPSLINSNGYKNKNANKTVSSKQLQISLIPFKHFQKIKKCNKKIRSIQSGKSKELNNILLKYKLKRDSEINFIQKELKHKLCKLRERAKEKQSQIVKEKQQQSRLLTKKIVKELQKIKEKMQLQGSKKGGSCMKMQELKNEIKSVFDDSVDSINHISSRRITRNRAKSHYSYSMANIERRKNIDFAKYKFGLTPSEINEDLKYLIIKQENDNYSYNNISLGFISHPTGFLNDRHLFNSQLTGMCYKTRSKRSRRNLIIKELHMGHMGDMDMDINDMDMEMENGQKCIFEKADEVDKDYVYAEKRAYDEEDDIATNAVFIHHVRFTSGDKIRIIENNVNGNEDNVLCGVIKCVMKYHMKVITNGNKPKRIRYKDISKGHFSVFLQA